MAAGRMERSCAKCASNPVLKEMWGCEEDGREWVLYRGRASEMTIKRCPLALITEETKTVAWAYGFYVERILPYGGGLLDQPAALIEAIKIYGGYIEEARRG